MRSLVVALATATLCFGVAVRAQDSQSLGDVARQARLQKQQKEAQSKASAGQSGSSSDSGETKAAHVISNENMFEHAAPVAAAKPDHDADKQEDSSNAGSQIERAEQIKSAIQSQKAAIASLKEQIENVSNSIHFAGGNCIANCVQWNERQKEKQDEVERMKGQLEEQQKRLDDMQESARKQGFGSSIYDP